MPSSGSDGSGLKLAASLGLKASEPFPSLAPVRAASPVLKAVKGLRCRGRASLLADRKTVKQETGEIQFTDQGLSGICILNLSRLVGEFFSHRTVNRHKTEKVELSLDLVPDLDYSSLLSFLQALISGQPRLPWSSCYPESSTNGLDWLCSNSSCPPPFPALAAACPLQN